MDVDIEALRREIGRKVEETDVVTVAPLRGLAVTFDRNEDVTAPGSAIPPGWHLAYFVANTPRAKLAADGLPVESDVMPEMPLPRRMFAGTSLEYPDQLRVGEEIRRETELTDINAREGSTGVLIFTTVTRRFFGPRGLALVEDWNTVFREEVAPGAKSAVPRRDAPPADLPWQREIEPDAVMLFRYSALTFNPHRIHYDRPYAMNEEGYPGLVVHGPFVEQCLLDLARDHFPGRPMKRFDMRARAPLFDTAPFQVVGRPSGEDGCELWAVTPEGTTAMTATARFG